MTTQGHEVKVVLGADPGALVWQMSFAALEIAQSLKQGLISGCPRLTFLTYIISKKKADGQDYVIAGVWTVDETLLPCHAWHDTSAA